MSSLKSVLLLMIASAGLATASSGKLLIAPDWLASRTSPDYIPASLSELDELKVEQWVEFLKEQYPSMTVIIDATLELVKKLDKIYESLGDKVGAQIRSEREQKIAEQFEVNAINGDQFCATDNFVHLRMVVGFYSQQFISFRAMNHEADYCVHVANYFHDRESFFAFLCRSYTLKKFNKAVDSVDETYKRDIVNLGNQLILAKSEESLSNENELSSQIKFSAKWTDILLAFLKQKADKQDKLEFNSLWSDSVVRMCESWNEAVGIAKYFERLDHRQREDYTDEQARWMQYSKVCADILRFRNQLAKLLHKQFKSATSGKSGKVSKKIKEAISKGLNKLACSGCKK